MRLIYVVEASATYQKIFQQHLEQLGCSVQVFTSATECLRALQKKPDLILLSQHLANGEKGIDFLAAFRAKAKQVPLVMLAEDGDVYTGAQALEMGAFGYIEKNGAALVRLRTAIDNIPQFHKKQRQRNLMLWVAIAAAVAGLVALVIALV